MIAFAVNWQHIGSGNMYSKAMCMKKIILIVIAAVVFAACNNAAENTTTTDSTSIRTSDSLNPRPDNTQANPNPVNPNDTTGSSRKDSMR
jgi:hypothetical protein